MLTDWRVPPIDGCQVRLRVGPVEAHLARSRSGVARETGEPGRQAAGEIEEVQLLHLPGEPPQLAGQADEERVPEAGVAVEQLAEAVAGQGPRLAGFQRHGCRRARLTVEQSQLPEGVPSAKRRDDGLLAVMAGQHDLDGAAAHEVQ